MANKKEEKGITVKKEEDMPEWYSQVCLKSGMADFGPVKGTMIIKPLGYSIWEKIQENFNRTLKRHNVKNAYFPLFIPESFLKKEAEHAKGFQAEVAWVEKKEEGERIALRPTSETVMYDAYSKWIKSWRDLPLKINQWCNVVRWEVSDTKLFLRSREFLWQEGHCVYETEKQCEKEVWNILDEYEKLCKELLAIPVLKGKKTEKETFAGSVYTTTIEAFMPDGKALQCGTSHNLGQNFAKAFNIKYLDKNEKTQIPFQNSWGFSTRLIGAMVMTHSDDKGLVLPPKIAPTQIVIIPILIKGKEKGILKKAKELETFLRNSYSVELDERTEYTPGWKFSEYEMKGVPLRIEIGPNDIKKNQVVLVRRDNNKKIGVNLESLNKKIKTELDNMQKSIYEKAKHFLDFSIKKVSEWNEFIKVIKNRQIALSPFCGDVNCEDNIKDKSGGAGSRCIKEDIKDSKVKCIYCKKPAKYLVYFSKSY